MQDTVPWRKVRFVFHATDAAPLRWTSSRLDHFYASVAEHYRAHQHPTLLEVEWPAGITLTPDFHRYPLQRQRERFAPGTSILNSVRTRLTELTDELLALCNTHFDAIELLVRFAEGRSDHGAALVRARELIAEGIDVRCTIVLSKCALADVEQIVHAYASAGIQSRLVPLLGQKLSTSLDDEDEANRLTAGEALDALKRAFEANRADPRAVPITPLSTYLDRILHYHDATRPSSFCNRRDWETTYIVDADGDVCGTSEIGRPDSAYGNLFATPFADIVSGAEHQRAIDAAERRLAAVCTSCRYFGSCDGQPVADGLEPDPTTCSVVRPMLAYLEDRLDHLGVLRRTPNRRHGRADAPMFDSLHPGARIQFLIDDSESRVSLSAGTAPAPWSANVRYLVGAIVPREPWRPATAREVELLNVESASDSRPQWRLDSDVALFRIPDQALEPLVAVCEACGLYDHAGPLHGVSHIHHPGWESACLTLFDYLRQYQLDERLIEATTLYTTAPGQRTVTKVNRTLNDREAFTGLHLDSWEGTSLRRRSRSRNRLCINVGPEDRHFLFVNLTVTQMMQALGLADSADVREVGLFLGHKFLRRFPEYPVVRVRIAPREGYIAATGNLVHDGDSLQKQLPDVALHLLGHFAASAPAGRLSQ